MLACDGAKYKKNYMYIACSEKNIQEGWAIFFANIQHK